VISSSGVVTFLLDTDVFSFLLKGDSRKSLYIPMLAGHRLALSFMTVAEVYINGPRSITGDPGA
jgi:predicted nucleic acid-binding protein